MGLKYNFALVSRATEGTEERSVTRVFEFVAVKSRFGRALITTVRVIADKPLFHKVISLLMTFE